jgi:hypothetical protein
MNRRDKGSDGPKGRLVYLENGLFHKLDCPKVSKPTFSLAEDEALYIWPWAMFCICIAEDT